MSKNVLALFESEAQATRAVTDLVAAGFDNKTISVVATEEGGVVETEFVTEEGNRAGPTAVKGMASGLVVGSLLGLLVGASTLAAGPLGLVVAGPIAGLVTGASLGAAGGSIMGALIGLGIPEERAQIYAEKVQQGGILVTMEVPALEAPKAQAILIRCGAVDVEERAALYTSAEQEIDPTAAALESQYEMVADAALLEDVPGHLEPDLDDEEYFRSHFKENYPAVAGDFTTFRTAYRFGFDFANKVEYTNLDWPMSEPHARGIWESANGLTWDRFREAVHAGWARGVARRPRAALL
jgi:hypothetical protein